jgi:hypothetical protein
MARQRTYRSNIMFSLLGAVTFSADIVGVTKAGISSQSDLKTICTECDSPLTRSMNCAAHGAIAEPRRAREVDDVLVPLTDAQVDFIAGTNLPTGVVNIIHVEPAELAAAVRPGESAYRVRPAQNKKKQDIPTPGLALLTDMVSAGRFTFIAEVKLGAREREILVQLEVWNDQLILQELIRPEDLADADKVTPVEYDLTALDMLAELLEHRVETFDPTSVANPKAARMAALESTELFSVPATVTAVVAPSADLLGALAASLEAARAAAA